MRRVGIVPLAALSMVMLASTAEASRMDFQAGGNGAIVWDGADDVSTMNEDCDPGACFTSLFGADLGILFTPDTLNAVTLAENPHMILSVAGADPAACATSAFCLTLGEFTDVIGSWESRTTNSFVDVSGSLQTLIRLTTIVSATNPNFYELSADSLAFLSTIDPAVLATWRVGFDGLFSVDPTAELPVSYSMEVAQNPSASVPEPGTLALLAVGLAGAAMRRRTRPALGTSRT